MRHPSTLKQIAKLLVGLSLLAPELTFGQKLAIPPGSQTTWVVEGAEEIIAHFAFDTEAVAERLPDGLVFLTMAGIASAGNETAQAHLARHPDQAEWGVSFLEIVRQDVFDIDGRSPKLSNDDAFALWFAGVRPSDGSSLSPGRLALNLWVPDSAYARYMREKGHYASYGVVKLSLSEDSTWVGRIEADCLRVEARCFPKEEVRSLGSGGGLVYPPANAQMSSVVRTSYAGHKERLCGRDNWWLSGMHPLATASKVAQGVFQFGYSLRGGAYPE